MVYLHTYIYIPQILAINVGRYIMTMDGMGNSIPVFTSFEEKHLNYL